MTKVYIVTQEWRDTNENQQGFSINRAFCSLHEAKQFAKSCRDNLLRNKYNATLEEVLDDHHCVTISKSNLCFMVADARGQCCDSITVHTLTLVGADTYIDIMFPYNGKVYTERIYLDDVDREKYDDIWNWRFGDKSDSVDYSDNLSFEVFAEKHKDGELAMTGMCINVYKRGDDTPVKTIQTENIMIHESWNGHNIFEPATPSAKGLVKEDYITFNGRKFPIKHVTISNKLTDRHGEVSVAKTDLWKAISDDDGEWLSAEAKSIDESIFYYCTEEEWNRPTEDLIDLLEGVYYDPNER